MAKQKIKMKTVHEAAKPYGVRTVGVIKGDAIRRVQTAEGNMPCFSSGMVKECYQSECLWSCECHSYVEALNG